MACKASASETLESQTLIFLQTARTLYFYYVSSPIHPEES